MKERNSIFNVITNCQEFLSWLYTKEGTSFKEMPEEYKDDFKQLDKLGIVYKRNNLSLGIRWQRLRRLVQRNGQTGETPYTPSDILNYLGIPTPQTSQ